MSSKKIFPQKHLSGTLRIPGDKSISHRAIMFSAISEGSSLISAPLMSEDVKATINCFKAMGVRIEDSDPDQVVVHGVGLHGLKKPESILDCGNSGTTMRLMMGLLAGQNFDTTLTGDASLNKRPMGRVIDPLEKMGAQIVEERKSDTERFIRIHGGKKLNAIQYDSPVSSAQVKSCIALAGLYADGQTIVREPYLSRNHTELMLQAKGLDLQSQGTTLTLNPGSLRAENFSVPGDISSAAFFIVAGLLADSGELLLENVGVNPTRTGILDVLDQMGAAYGLKNKKKIMGEDLADILIRPSQLKAALIEKELVPRLIDEIPIIALLTSQANGKSEFKDVRELRVKESDRIETLEKEISKLGVRIHSGEDFFSIEGPTRFQASQFVSYGDHRIAMTCAIASLFADGPSVVQDVGCVETSFPDFWECLKSLDVRVC